MINEFGPIGDGKAAKGTDHRPKRLTMPEIYSSTSYVRIVRPHSIGDSQLIVIPRIAPQPATEKVDYAALQEEYEKKVAAFQQKRWERIRDTRDSSEVYIGIVNEEHYPHLQSLLYNLL